MMGDQTRDSLAAVAGDAGEALMVNSNKRLTSSV